MLILIQAFWCGAKTLRLSQASRWCWCAALRNKALGCLGLCRVLGPTSLHNQWINNSFFCTFAFLLLLSVCQLSCYFLLLLVPESRSHTHTPHRILLPTKCLCKPCYFESLVPSPLDWGKPVGSSGLWEEVRGAVSPCRLLSWFVQSVLAGPCGTVVRNTDSEPESRLQILPLPPAAWSWARNFTWPHFSWRW